MSEKISPMDFELVESIDEGVIKSPEEKQRELQERTAAVRQKIEEVLARDLYEQEINQKVLKVPALTQEYGTDCAIALARMAIAYYGEEDRGTDGFVQEAKDLGVAVPEVLDASGRLGPQGDISAIMKVLHKHGISLGPSRMPLDEWFVESIRNGELIYLSINFHTLHPEDETALNRNHAILAKGYRLNEEGRLTIVVNDPKPEVGGEKELTEAQFTETLEWGSAMVFRKENSVSDSPDRKPA